MSEEIDRDRFEVLVPEERIQRRVRSLSREIQSDYEPGKRLCVVGVLKGGFVFLSDLIRALDLPVSVRFVGTSSYGNGTTPSDRVRIDRELHGSVEGEDVLLVEDIVDTGRTVKRLREKLAGRSPRSISICTMFFKPARFEETVRLDYVGLEVPDRFVVGYGLDHGERYRGLPFLAASPEADGSE